MEATPPASGGAGNGRLHRFLIHNVLARREFGPADVILPVSAAILRDRRAYDHVLEDVSGPITDLVPWWWTADDEVAVEDDTADLYRYFDATAIAEFLFERLADAVEHDLSEELVFLTIFDRARPTRAATEVIENRAASRFVVVSRAP